MSEVTEVGTDGAWLVGAKALEGERGLYRAEAEATGCGPWSFSGTQADGWLTQRPGLQEMTEAFAVEVRLDAMCTRLG